MHHPTKRRIFHQLNGGIYQDQKAIAPPNQEANIPPGQGGNKPLDQKAIAPSKQEANIPPGQGGNKPLDQKATTSSRANIPPAQRGNKPLDQKANAPSNQEANIPPAQRGNSSLDQKANAPSNQEANIPPGQGGNKPLDQKAIAPSNQEANIPPAQGGNKPLDQKATTPSNQEANIPPAQGGNKPLDFKANIPSNLGAKTPTDPGTNILLPAQGRNKPLDQKATPTPSNPYLPQIPLSLPDSNKETTNRNTGPRSTTQPLPQSISTLNPMLKGINLSPTQSQNIFQPNTRFNMLNPFQIPNLRTSNGSVFTFQENKDIPGPVTNQLSFQSNASLMKGQKESETLSGVNPITQGSNQEVSPLSQPIDQMSPVQTSGKPPNTPLHNITTPQHPPTDNTKSIQDITEANNNQSLINTRPSNQFTTPRSGANEPTYSDSSFKSLVSPNLSLLSTSMSEKDPSQLLEEIKRLDSDLVTQRSKANEAEKKEKSLLSDNKNLKADITRLTKESEQRKEENTAKDSSKQKVSNELQAVKQKVASLESEKKKTTEELKASKKECEHLKGQFQQYSNDLAITKSDTQNLNKEKLALATKLADIESKSKNIVIELEAKQKEFDKLKETQSIEIRNLRKTMEESKAGDIESVNEQKKQCEAKESSLKQFEEELQSTQAAITAKHKTNMQEITQLKQQTAQLINEETKLKEIIFQLQTEKDHDAARMNSCVDIDLLTKIEEVFIGLSKQEPPPEYTPGTPDRVEWLVSTLTSWNAQLSENISKIESLLHEKETEIDIHKEELQAILNFLQQHKPTNKSWTTSSTSSPLRLIQAILTERTDQLAKANVCKLELERYNKTMEVQITESRQHYKDESKKNDQLMQDNADLERSVQRLTSEKEELEIKNVELINQLSAGPSDIDNFNDPSLQLHNMDPTFVQELLHSRPSPLPLGMVSPFPFEAPPSPPPSTFSLTQGHRSTLQKAADELSHLKVKVWESEAETSKLREQLSVRNRDPSLPATASPDAESAFQAVFEANQSNLMKLAESNREKDLLCRDVEFLRQRVEELEKNIQRHKVSIEVKEVAYKELYSECRDWERKYKKCGHVNQEMERVKRQLMRREAETQECATLRAERLNQQTTLDNLVAELQERKKAEQILTRENQKLHAKLEESLQHITNMQSRIQDHIVIEPQKNPKPEEIQHLVVPHPHPASPTILKPPSMSSVPLSPPTRQPATKRHPPILYPPTNS